MSFSQYLLAWVEADSETSRLLIVLKKIGFDDRFAVLVHNFLMISNPLHYSCWRMNLLKSKKVTMEMLMDDMMLMVDLRPKYQSVKILLLWQYRFRKLEI